MMKLIVSCIWIIGVTAGSAYFSSVWKSQHAQAEEAAPPAEKIEFKKTRAVNVPIIANGAVQGYVVAQFVYSMNTEAVKESGVPPEAYLIDEAFRAFYTDQKLDFKHLERYDITSLTKALVVKVNERLHGNVVKDLLVDEFNYVSKDEISK